MVSIRYFLEVWEAMYWKCKPSAAVTSENLGAMAFGCCAALLGACGEGIAIEETRRRANKYRVKLIFADKPRCPLPGKGKNLYSRKNLVAIGMLRFAEHDNHHL